MLFLGILEEAEKNQSNIRKALLLFWAVLDCYGVFIVCIMNRIVFPIEDTSQRETCNGIYNKLQESQKAHWTLKENSLHSYWNVG